MRPIDILMDLCWGSCGKGKFAPLLAKRDEYDVVATANGPNAGHTRIHNGQREIFKCLPSASGLSPIAALCPTSVSGRERLLMELGRASEVIIHENARLLLDTDARMEESSPWAKHGSTCQGTALPMIRRITRQPEGRIADAEIQWPNHVRIVDNVAWRERMFASKILFEGAQGHELSVDWGEFPYTTSRNCTTGAALDAMGISPRRLRNVYGLFRAHPIRVGNPVGGYSGPLPYETTWRKILDDANAPSDYPIEQLELTTVTKRLRRVTDLDLERLYDACQMNGVNQLILNFAQYLDWAAEGVTEWARLPPIVLDFIKKIENVTGIEIAAVGTSETAECWREDAH